MNILKKLFKGQKNTEPKDELSLKTLDRVPYGALVKELLAIAKITSSSGTTGFNEKDEKGHSRTREIGSELYYMANKATDFMQKGHAYVDKYVGKQAADELSASWHEIGHNYYIRKQGMCWEHTSEV